MTSMDNLYNRTARRRRTGQQGFTLIELLVVIAVLAVLAGIVIFNVTGVTNRGNQAACQTDLKSVQTASDAYFNDNGSYPAGVATLVPAYLHTAPTDLGTVTWTAGNVTSSLC
jgi:prepilin-type N-terminal cleavage/methylation domain-containing protein